MQSFRTELENPVVEQDIIELERKIRLFQEGRIDEERFRSLRLARGVYGQRQPGVQMIRIKIPYGKLSVRQLRRICDVADEYSTGKLHITTRQDIQIHYVSLDRTPQLWAELEKDEVTLREACGNTVRNVTASVNAGIDPEEPFDVSPYAEAFFRYFLRNPVCQEMGRKFKVSFSSSKRDSALAFMHDLGFIPKLDGEQRGFRVMIGGGLGAQPIPAQLIHEFLPVDQLIPFSEAVIRLFDRHGERSKRFKARFKFLLKDWGLTKLREEIEQERLALPYPNFPIDLLAFAEPKLKNNKEWPQISARLGSGFDLWKTTNVEAQKQEGYYSVSIKVKLGDLSTAQARKLSDLVEQVAADDLRLSINQGIQLRFLRLEALPWVYQRLSEIGLADAGFDSTLDITACPGTDTCNLGISSSTGISEVLEQVMREEYPHLVHNLSLKIKISGCMNACGQHSMAGIGFHGSTLKVGNAVAPALQILLGGGVLGNGEAVFAQKVIKIPSRRGPNSLRRILDDYEEGKEPAELFHQYYQRKGKKYFYALLKDLADQSNLLPEEFIDWGKADDFVPAIGVGECAGVVIDLVQTLLFESEEKLEWAGAALKEGRYADSIYHSYTALVNTAKALLTSKGLSTNTQAGIIRQFDEHFVESGEFTLSESFAKLVYQMRTQAPKLAFATAYLAEAESFYAQAKSL